MAVDQEANFGSGSNGRAVEIFNLIFRHLFLITFASGVGVGLGYLAFLRTPPQFQSSSQLHVRNDAKNHSTPFDGLEKANATPRDQPHAVLIVSPMVVERALQMPLDSSNERRLRDLPCFANLDNPAADIISRLTAHHNMPNGSENQDIVNLRYRDADALTSKAVLDAIIESYKEFLMENHKNVSVEVLKLIDEARVSLLKQLQEIETEYTQFREDSPLMFNKEDNAANFHKDRMGEIELTRRNLLILMSDKKAQLQSINDALAHGGSREAISLMLQNMKPDSRAAEAGIKSPASEIFQLQLEEQLMLQELGPDHPKVKSLQKKLSLTQQFFLNQTMDNDPYAPVRKEDFLTVCLNAFKYEINTIESRILELDELFEAERHHSKSVAAYELKNSQYQKDMDRTEALYQRILKRLDELNLLQDYGGYKTSIISPPAVGVYVAPIFAQYLLIGAVCGAALGFGLAYLAESNDRSFRTPEEVSEQLGLPIVGHVPVIPPVSTAVRNNAAFDPTLVTVLNPKSRMAESYRAIRTSLFFSTRGGQHKVIQLTSPTPGDGKTTVCANLAASIAQSGKKVILIDGDFRRPRVHQLFKLDKSVGMSSLIGDDLELPDAIQFTDVANLWCLPCGPIPNNPSELLSSPRFEELLNLLREQYDFVIIDTPPLLAVTDPSAVAARVDGVILTIRLSKRARSEATRAAEMLATLGANTIGLVVNGVGTKAGYGYGGYNYQYGYNYNYQRESPYYANEDGVDDEYEVSGGHSRRGRGHRRNG